MESISRRGDKIPNQNLIEEVILTVVENELDSIGSGLPEGGTPGQVVINIGAGEGDWDTLTAADVNADISGAAATAQAAAIQRVNHTGTQTATTIADFTEAVQDAVAALLGAGSNVTLNYSDVTDTLTITTADTNTTDPEAVRDAIGIALVAVGLIGISVNDGADTITISTTATANATNEQLRDRATHTGSQPVSTVTSLQAALDSFITAASIATLTNKRITQRVLTIVSNATPTINTDNYDCVRITTLATAITSMTTNLTGTPGEFDTLVLRFKDDGTARAITWGASFEAAGVALPTTTVANKRLTTGFIWDTVSSKWGCVSSAQEA